MPYNKSISLLSIVLLLVLLPACSSTGKQSTEEEIADVQLQLGVRYLAMEKLRLAKDHLEKAVNIDPDNAEAHNALAFLYEKIQSLLEAREHYESALDLSPEDTGVLNNFGRFLCEQGEYETGISYLQQAATNPLNSRQWLALTNAGRCEVGQDNLETAEAYFRQALQQDPTYAPALLEMQKLSYKKGDYWSAKGFLGRYLGVAKHTAESLWYGYQSERALGHRESAMEYKKSILEKFPLSDEAQQIKSARRNRKHGR